ncbi:hypothetical protein AW168_30555 [Nocardia brasiliensis]|uniref:Uncharacterized protein n=1 Tax=Nocardia brasiliensis (strain ATCC 700358 / HUJEG-1) TaxID=1133849 RepID=K0F4J7_NOCB7|nr:hypothetical protein O3I_022555 [Nocardia brasiliensis ATCC 700358]OCF86434.1 hypothetical protein AW168_30555 [Nocardia brasiliensis]
MGTVHKSGVAQPAGAIGSAAAEPQYDTAPASATVAATTDTVRNLWILRSMHSLAFVESLSRDYGWAAPSIMRCARPVRALE